MEKILILDFNAMLYPAINVHKYLSFGDLYTGGIFGFIKVVTSYINRFKPSKILVCNDSPPYLRKADYPEYKADRVKCSEISKRAEESRPYCYEFLNLLGAVYWEEAGLEADDLIYIACRNLGSKYGAVIVASGDDDLYQIFKYQNTFVLKNKKLYNEHQFQKEFGLSVEEWIKFLSLKGTHNGIKGIKGIGGKKALQIIKNGEYAQMFEKHKELSLYLKLIRLPYKRAKMPDFEERRFNKFDVIHFLRKFGIQKTIHMDKAFYFLNT